MISWLFRKFWRASPRFGCETQWNMVQEEDAWEGIRYQLERIAHALNQEESE